MNRYSLIDWLNVAVMLLCVALMVAIATLPAWPPGSLEALFGR